MKQSIAKPRIAVLALGLSAGLALAACGSSSKTTVGAQSSATTQPASSNAKPVVKTTMTANFGPVLVDTKGMTLYTLTNGGKAVACTGQSASVWPPVLLPSGVGTAVGEGVSGLATVASGSSMQVTSGGLPLYRFTGDAAPGDTNGEGIVNFGGTWHVATASGSANATPAPTMAPAATTPTTSYSYGY